MNLLKGLGDDGYTDKELCKEALGDLEGEYMVVYDDTTGSDECYWPWSTDTWEEYEDSYEFDSTEYKLKHIDYYQVCRKHNIKIPKKYRRKILSEIYF